MSNRHLFWAMAAMAAMPLFAATTTDDYAFRYSTLDRVGKLAVRPTSEATDLSFTLNAETFDKAVGLGTEWRPVAFVPPTVTVTAISVAIPGTDAPAFITVTPKDGNPVEFMLADGAEGAAAEPAAFRSGTAITLQAVKNGQVADLPEAVKVTEVADLAGTPLADPATRAATRAAAARYFSLPYEALKTDFGTAPILLRPSATNPVELGAQ